MHRWFAGILLACFFMSFGLFPLDRADAAEVVAVSVNRADINASFCTRTVGLVTLSPMPSSLPSIAPMGPMKMWHTMARSFLAMVKSLMCLSLK